MAWYYKVTLSADKNTNKLIFLSPNFQYKHFAKAWDQLYPAGNYMFKVNNRNSRARCETFSKLIKKTPERCQRRHSGVFIINLEHILHLVLLFLLLTLSR